MSNTDRDPIPPVTSPDWQAWVIQGALVLILLVLLPMAFAPIRYSVGVIQTFPYQLDREEGFILNQALTIRSGESIYQSIHEGPPWLVGNYTPIYPAVTGLLHFPSTPSLAVGRIISLASTIGIALLLMLAIFLERRMITAAILAGFLFLVTNDVYYWIPFARVDFAALLLTMGAMAWAGKGSPRVYIPACAILFTLAFHTKQTQLMAPLAVAIALLFAGKKREGMMLAGVSMALGLITSLIMLAMTRGQFWLHTVTYNRNEYQIESLQVWFNHIWRFCHWWLPLILGGWIWLVYRNIHPRFRDDRSILELTAIVYLPLASLAMLAVGKVGSDRNYLLDFHLGGALISGLSIARAWSDRPTMPRLSPILCGTAVLLLMMHTMFLWSGFNRMATHRPVPGEQSRMVGDYLLLRTVETTGPVLSEDPIYTMLAGKVVDYEPFIMTRLSLEGHWDQQPFLDRLESRHYRLIIASQPMEDDLTVGFTPEMKATIRAHYELVEHLPLLPGRSFFLYRPNPH